MRDSGKPSSARNVFGGELAACCESPPTGFFRDGYCHTGPQDVGSHTVCAVMSQEFLEFSLRRGNDLVTPNPAAMFAGLRPGDRWCLCAARWKEAFDAGAAPKVVMTATHEKALAFATLAELKQHALDLQ